MAKTLKPADHVAAHVNGLKSSIHALEVQITILKQLCGIKSKAKDEEEENEEEEAEETEEAEESEEPEESEESEEEEEESEESEEEEEEEESEEEEAPKPKKITPEQINDACKKLHGRLVKKKKMNSKKAFAHIKALLTKHFDTESVTQIDKADRAKALKLLNAQAK